METKRNTFRVPFSIKSPSQILPIGSSNRRSSTGNMKNQNRFSKNHDLFHATGNSRMCSAPDHCRQAGDVGCRMFMTGTGSRDRSIVFDPDEKISPFMVVSIGQTNHCLDQIPVAQGARPFSLEFHVDRFTLSDQIPDLFWSHSPLSQLNRFPFRFRGRSPTIPISHCGKTLPL